MRKKIIAGNWKMNKTLDEAMDLAVFVSEHRDEIPQDVEVILCPPSLYLITLSSFENPPYTLAAQNCSQHDYGAFTGEISAAMLKCIGIQTCIIGHSERRQYFLETDDMLAKKVDACLRNDVRPIFCCGESLEERKGHHHFVTVLHQIEKALFHLDHSQIKKVAIAYEPIWAIGTGVTATIDEAQEMHAFIRQSLGNHFGNEISNDISILYGGSVKPSNAKELFDCPDVDGGLIGGASLHKNDFLSIIRNS